MDEPVIFFHREDQWQIPAPPNSATRNPYLRHMVMRLPGEAKEEYIEMTPFTPRQKDNLAAWMVARNDGAQYGKLAVYRFPRQSLVFGPTQILSRIELQFLLENDTALIPPLIGYLEETITRMDLCDQTR